MILELLLALTLFSIGLLLMKKSAGTFNLGKLNLIHIVFILFILQIFIGTILVKFGFTNHYTNRLLLFKSDSVNMLFAVVLFTVVIWPLFTWLFLKMFKVKSSRDYNQYLKKEISTKKRTAYIYLGLNPQCVLTRTVI